jgi:hypothetical protein
MVRRVLVLSGWLFLTAGCRDEQAGPRPRPPPAPAQRVLDAAPTDLSFRSGATFAQGAIRYLGSTVTPRSPNPGDKVTLRHYFKAEAAQPAGFQFFVHLVDADSMQMLANADHDIQDGALPLGRWPVGKVVEDVHSFAMPTSPSGSVRVLMGFWQGQTRLPVDSAEAHDGQMRLSGPLLGARAEPLPETTAVRTTKAPTIDGDLSDPVWGKANVVRLVNSFDGSPASLRTEARILFDDRFLYVAFESEDPDVWGTLMKRDEPIYNEEVVEVFLDADANGRTYNELQVSPNNVQFDAYFPARRQGMDTSYDAQMKTAVKIRGTLNNPSDTDEGWSAEMAIPFERLNAVPNVPPKAKDRWRFNLFRLEHVKRRQIEGQAFSALHVGDFHYLPRFGWLVFGD